MAINPITDRGGSSAERFFTLGNSFYVGLQPSTVAEEVTQFYSQSFERFSDGMECKAQLWMLF